MMLKHIFPTLVFFSTLVLKNIFKQKESSLLTNVQAYFFNTSFKTNKLSPPTGVSSAFSAAGAAVVVVVTAPSAAAAVVVVVVASCPWLPAMPDKANLTRSQM